MKFTIKELNKIILEIIKQETSSIKIETKNPPPLPRSGPPPLPINNSNNEEAIDVETNWVTDENSKKNLYNGIKTKFFLDKNIFNRFKELSTDNNIISNENLKILNSELKKQYNDFKEISIGSNGQIIIKINNKNYSYNPQTGAGIQNSNIDEPKDDIPNFTTYTGHADSSHQDNDHSLSHGFHDHGFHDFMHGITETKKIIKQVVKEEMARQLHNKR